MSVDESDEYEKPYEAGTERATNSFNLNAELHNQALIPKLAVGFDDEDQVRFTASPQTTHESKRNSEKAESAVETCQAQDSKRTQQSTRANFVTPSIFSKAQSPANLPDLESKEVLVKKRQPPTVAVVDLKSEVKIASNHKKRIEKPPEQIAQQ